jgi:hypothetical protein
LEGTLVLQNNSGDDLPITADGTFTFDTALEDGDSYSVTVLTRPILQNCTLAGETGKIDSADIADVLVTLTDKAWSHPAYLSDNICPDGQSTNDPRVSLVDDGNAVIVWRQRDGSTDQIFISELR